MDITEIFYFCLKLELSECFHKWHSFNVSDGATQLGMEKKDTSDHPQYTDEQKNSRAMPRIEVCKYAKNHCVIHLKQAKFMIYKLNLTKTVRNEKGKHSTFKRESEEGQIPIIN